jgi:molybdopterin molybdotransferase
VRNIATRHELAERLGELATLPDRSLIIVDVALGWPVDVARVFVPRSPTRASMTRLLTSMVDDGPTNANNRFEVAAELNRSIGVAVFWGHPVGHAYRGLAATRTTPRGLRAFCGERLRRLERACGGTIKSPLQLYGNGSVGSQSILAQVMFERLRRGGVDLALWPYEDSCAQVVVAEEFFARRLFVEGRGAVRDERQVRAVTSVFADDLRHGRDPLSTFDARALSATARRGVMRTEGWLARLPVTPQ